MSAFIYVNHAGKEVNSWSYSSGQVFESCRQKFHLQKVAGWRQKGSTAASKFGVAVEDAVQFFHADGMKPESGVDHFKLRWVQFRDGGDLTFKEKEGQWQDFYQMGAELMALYELTVPSMPIVQPEFQLRYAREIFPGTELAGITDQGFVDMLSRAPWNHPMLPKVERPRDSAYRPLIIDIKVSGKGLDLTPNLLQLDPQLRRYASFSGVQDVGFLWFHRSKPYSYEKGTEVTFLKPSGKWTPGLRAVIHEYDSETQKALVAAHHDIETIKAALDEVKGKGTKDRKANLTSAWLINGTLTEVPVECITKQRIRFVAVRIPEEDIREEARVVAKQVVEARQAHLENFWPKDGAGVRFPNNACTWCEFRGCCLKDDKLRDSMLVQIQPAATDDWLDEILEEEV